MENKMNEKIDEKIDEKKLLERVINETIKSCTQPDQFDIERDGQKAIDMVNLCIRIKEYDEIHVSSAAAAMGPSEARCMIEGLEPNTENMKLVDADGYVFNENYVRVEWGWVARTGSYWVVLNEIKYNFKPYTEEQIIIAQLIHEISCAEAYIHGEDMEATIILVRPPNMWKAVGANYKLHCVDGPAIQFDDGSCLYALNGVSIQRENRDLVTMTNIDADTAKRVLQIKNVDERAQLIKLHGIENFQKFGTIIDDSDTSVSKYAIIDMGTLYDEGVEALFLRMNNLSEKNKIHLEGVDNNCMTVQDALDFRARKILDFTGDKHWTPGEIDGVVMPGGNPLQWQQGDVLGRDNETFKKCDFDLDALPHLALRGADSRHVPTSGKLFKVSDDIEFLQTDGAIINHPEHDSTSRRLSCVVGSVEAYDHETGIIEAILD